MAKREDEKKPQEEPQVQEDPTVLNDEYEFGGGGDEDGEKE